MSRCGLPGSTTSTFTKANCESCVISELGQPPELADDPSPKSAAGVVPVWSLESVAAGNAVLGKSLRGGADKAPHMQAICRSLPH